MKQNTRKKPMTTAEFFNTICDILKEKGKWPDILDYALATCNPVTLTNDEFEIMNNLDYGGSEGIYLVLGVKRIVTSGRTLSWMQPLGTFKTLDASSEAMHAMAALLADFIIEQNAYVHAHPDDFTWEGVNIHPADATGNPCGPRYTCNTMKAALKRKDKLVKEYPKVIVKDNVTRTEKIYERRGKDEQ